MADPGGVSPANPDSAFARANAEIAALKKAKPKTDAEARARSCELMRLNEILLEASRKVVDANAAKRIANAGNGVKPASGKGHGFTQGELTALARGLVPWVMEVLAPLKADIAELKARPTMKYEGVWEAQKVYSVGDLTTFQGGMWFCTDANVGVRPGTGPSWKLAVKRGKADR